MSDEQTAFCQIDGYNFDIEEENYYQCKSWVANEMGPFCG